MKEVTQEVTMTFSRLMRCHFRFNKSCCALRGQMRRRVLQANFQSMRRTLFSSSWSRLEGRGANFSDVSSGILFVGVVGAATGLFSFASVTLTESHPEELQWWNGPIEWNEPIKELEHTFAQWYSFVTQSSLTGSLETVRESGRTREASCLL